MLVLDESSLPEALEERPGNSLQDVLLKSYFDEPRWPLNRVVPWIAIRNVEAFTLTYEDISHLRHKAVILKGNDGILISKNPFEELVVALRADKIKAVGSANRELPPAVWDTVLSHDLRTWPEGGLLRFPREDVLRLFPYPTVDENKTESVKAATLGLTVTGPKEPIEAKLEDRVVEFLRNTYPSGRPNSTNKALLLELHKTLGRRVGMRTLNRAI